MDTEKKRHVGAEVKMISNMIHRRLIAGQVFEEDQLTASNGWILGYLAHNEDREVYQRELEEKFRIRRATVSKTLGLMEQKGLIERVPVEHDARLKRLLLTEKGRRHNAEMIAEFDRIESEITEGIPPEKLGIFFEVCDEIKNKLNELEGKGE